MANPGTENRHRKVQIGLRLSVRERDRLQAMAEMELGPEASIQEFIRLRLLGNPNEDKRKLAHSLNACWCGMPHHRDDFL